MGEYQNAGTYHCSAVAASCGCGADMVSDKKTKM